VEIKTLLQIITLLLGSAVVGTILSNFHTTRLKRKELIAGATKSALRRVEMYYRVLRRTGEEDDAVAIRNLFHEVQEENDYYKSLLSIESVWHGALYGRFIEALKRETMSKIQAAWDREPLGPGAKLQGVGHPDVAKFVEQFTRDSKRLFNPFLRLWMRARHWFRKHIKDDGYGPQ
jgi:hypothetical protein